MKRQPLTAKQIRLILEVTECGDYGLVPTPTHLGDCEELKDRGTFRRSMQSGHATYRLSDAYKAVQATVQAAEDRIQDQARFN